jgi:hypothetical protein
MSLRVISHTPTIYQSGVFRNEKVKVYFNQPIEPTSVKWDVMSVNDSYSFSSVVGSLAPIWASGVNLSGVTSGMMFVPTIYFLPNTEYTVYVYSTPNSVIAKDKSEVLETYSYNFITGTGYYDASGVAGAPSGIATGVYSVVLSGIRDFEEDDITEFKVYKTIPKNQTPNISGSTIQVFFTGNISTSSGDISQYINLTEETVL